MELNFLNKSSRVYAEADPFQVSDYVNRHVGPHVPQFSSASRNLATLSHSRLGSLDLCRLSYGCQTRVLSDGLPDLYHVQFVLSGQCNYGLDGESLSLSAGHVLVINPGESIDLTYSEGCEKFIVKIPSSMFSDVCLEHRWIQPQDCLRFKQEAYRFEELDSLVSLMSLICSEAEEKTATPQILHHYTRVVASKLMTMLKHNVNLESPALHSACFERLSRYIEDNIKRDITAEELALHARMSLRSLYQLFEKNAKTTPKNFIRQKKLERIYANLMDPACKVSNITSLALDYGFTHLGRFSELYKSTFGLLPSDSLRERHLRIN